MLKLRYSAGKVWMNFAFALVAGVAIVVVLGSLWQGAAFAGGVGGLIAVVGMLLPGVLKRSARQEPFLTIDDRGVTVEVLGIGTISWGQIRQARLSGVPWVTGLRLVIDYAGTAPKVGLWGKLNWGIYVKRRGELARLMVGFVDMTDQPKSELERAISRLPAAAA